MKEIWGKHSIKILTATGLFFSPAVLTISVLTDKSSKCVNWGIDLTLPETLDNLLFLLYFFFPVLMGIFAILYAKSNRIKLKPIDNVLLVLDFLAPFLLVFFPIIFIILGCWELNFRSVI